MGHLEKIYQRKGQHMQGKKDKYSVLCQRMVVQSHPCPVACKVFMENKDGKFFIITLKLKLFWFITVILMIVCEKVTMQH